jgi:hypothetical protein
MTRTKNALLTAAMLCTGGLIAYPVYAHCGKCAADGKKIVAQMDENRLTLAKAVTAAETHSKGRAVSVLSQLNDNDKLAVEVFCIVGDKIMCCYVDGVAASISDMKEVKEFPIDEKAHAHDGTTGKPVDNKPGEKPKTGGGAGG